MSESTYFVLTIMGKDERYKYLRDKFNSGRAKKFADMFSGYPFLPKTVLAEDMGHHNDKITLMISNPERFAITELCDICDQIEIEPKAFLSMVIDNYLPKRYKLKG